VEARRQLRIHFVKLWTGKCVVVGMDFSRLRKKVKVAEYKNAATHIIRQAQIRPLSRQVRMLKFGKASVRTLFQFVTQVGR
jgi:hypothetical protein